MTAHHFAGHKLWHFHGGLHLPEHKETTRDRESRPLPLPQRLVLSLHQHIGEDAEPVVRVGERVWKGQLIARAPSYVSAPLHAPTSGTVTDIGEHPLPHPSGLPGPCIVIEPDGEDAWWPERPQGTRDYLELDPAEIRQRVRDAGIVGLGGAAFPTAVKLNPPAAHPVDTLVINGAECEPYITCDDRLMRERAREVLEGARIIRHALGVERVLVGIEDNKPEAFEALRHELHGESRGGIELIRVPTIYPTGGEKQLIKVLTGREVPSNGLPSDIGVVCQNVGTAAAVYRAIVHGEPLISRLVTVTGHGVAEPGNVEALIGTPIAHLVAHSGGYTEHAERLVMGGPMMGFALHTDELPIIKGTNCILVAREEEVVDPVEPMPCIRCGRCTAACPVDLLPQQLYWYAHARDFDHIQDYNLFDCIECGCCAYVCPSHLPLVHYYRYAKTEIWAQEREKEKADRARRRHEFRLERLEREKREKAERMAKKKAELAKKLKDKEKGGGQDAIQAALERVRQKKAAQGGAETDRQRRPRPRPAPGSNEPPAVASDAGSETHTDPGRQED